MKTQKGISLIALVVTILVMLILAGITLALTFGSNGLLPRAKQSEKAYEWGIVKEEIRLRLNDYYLEEYETNSNKTYLEYLFEDGYINLDSVVQMDRLSAKNFKYGKGNLEDGDVYYIADEKLYYMEKNGNTVQIDDLTGIGKNLPGFIFLEATTDTATINLDDTNETKLNISNYNDRETTRENLKYDITLLQDSTELYSVKIDDKELIKNETNEFPVIEGKVQKNIVHKLTVNPKKESIETEEKILLKIHGKTEGDSPRETVKNVEIKITPKALYWNSEVSSSNVELNVDNANVTLSIQNYNENKVTPSDIKYEISLEDKENNLFAVSINDTDLNQTNYSGTIVGGTQNKQDNIIKINKQEGIPIATDEQVKLKVKITEPIISEKDFVIDVKQYYLIDYSGNGYHGKLKNGAKIVKENGEYTLKLDGIDDYVELPTISKSHNWTDGIDIDGTFKCDEITNNGHILLLSNASPSDTNLSDQIMVRINGNEANIHFEAATRGTVYEIITNNTTTNFAIKQKQTFKVDMRHSAGFYYPIYLNGEKASNDGFLLPVFNYIKEAERKYNYIGKSYSNKEYFKGNIYKLSLNIEGESNYVFNYDVNR